MMVLEGGEICGNEGAHGGGVYVEGTFTMTGGVIRNNTAGTTLGGGVLVSGTFNMSGGKITGNTARSGGGVAVYETFIMTGGSITGNTARSLTSNREPMGGGVYLLDAESHFLISGSPEISGNTRSDGSADNVYLDTYRLSGDAAVITVDGNLSNTTPVGVRMGALGGTITNGLGGRGGLDNFVSDQGNLLILSADGGAVKRLEYADADGEVVYLRRNADGTWYFTMPDHAVAVTLTPDERVFGTPDFTLPASLTAIGEEAFEGSGMSVVDIPDTCLSIGDHAFRDCPRLAQIRVPEHCGLGEDVFEGCGTVTVFGVPGSPAETYCAFHENCVFVGEIQD